MYVTEPDVQPLSVDANLDRILSKINELETAGDWKGAREWKATLLHERSSRTDHNGIVSPTPREAAALAAQKVTDDAAFAARSAAESLARDAAAVQAHEQSPEFLKAKALAEAEARLAAAEAAEANAPAPWDGGPRDPWLPPLPPAGIGRY